MHRTMVLAAVWVAALAAGAGAADPPAAGLASVESVWPGYVPGGRFYRNLEWGVTMWGPGQADQQLETGSPGLLVRYVLSGDRKRPGWAITVLAGRVREELAADQVLAYSAAQLRKGLGRRVESVMIQAAPAGQTLIGRVSCRVGPADGQSGPGICRSYVYFRLRALQYLTLVGESGPEAVEPMNQALDGLAGSVRTFDPQAEAGRLAEAADRTAKLLSGVAPGDWAALARQIRPQWLRYCRGTRAQATPEGFGYLSAAADHDRRVDSVLATQVQIDGARLASYLTATCEPGAAGSEEVRAWGSVAPAGGGSAEQTFCIARRKPSASELEVLDKTLGGPQPRQGRHQAQIRSGPYLDHALLGPATMKMAQAAANARGPTLFGVFSFSPQDGQVVFQTFELAERETIQLDGRNVEAIHWLVRPSIGQPPTVRWTDPTGARLLRLEQGPDRWGEAVEEHTVPEPVRRALLTPPTWP